MKIAYLALLIFGMCSAAHADLYKCIDHGQTSYQESPCGPGKVSISMESDLSKRLKAEESAKLAEILAREKQKEELQAKYQEVVRNSRMKAERCDALLHIAMASKAEASVWGNPELRYAANIRLLNAEKAYAKECYIHRK